MNAPASMFERGEDVKRFAEMVWSRRAHPHFSAEGEVPAEDIEMMLALAGQAPSGFNLQPWRFVVVRDQEGRDSLAEAAMGQDKVREAPVVIVAFAERDGWRDKAGGIFETAIENGALGGDVEGAKSSAFSFIDKLPIEVWLTRHVMIAFTYLMLAAETLGWDTAPMEGFDPEAVKEALNLPADAFVIAMLAVGRHSTGDRGTRPHPGRLSVEQIAFQERHGFAWSPLQTSKISVKS